MESSQDEEVTPDSESADIPQEQPTAAFEGNENSESENTKGDNSDCIDVSEVDDTHVENDNEQCDLQSEKDDKNSVCGQGDALSGGISLETRELTSEESDDDDGNVDLGDLSDMNEEARNKLFGRALLFERDGKKNCALKCYIGCLSHMTQDTKFVLLPQCLRNIADLYYRKEEYEKAIYFIQAEKLFYENALVDTNEIQQKIEDFHKTNGEGDGGVSKVMADSLRADEYEHLAKLCIDKKQPRLALEYAGKATKLRQHIYGDDHPVTKQSLDFFATLYAEVGRHQYSESINKLSQPANSPAGQEADSSFETPSMERSPSSILRQRKPGDESKEKKQVRFEEPDATITLREREQEEWISQTLLSILLMICFILLTIIGVWLLCSLTTACQTAKADIHYYYMRFKYYYYQYASTKKIKYA